MDSERSVHLADLAAPKPRGLSTRGLAVFVGAVVAVVGLFVALGVLSERWTIWQAESFGDRRLLKPTEAECEIARAVIRDHHDRDLAALLHLAGAGEAKMELRAFAWRSSGARVPPGMDWRNCPGLGPYVRRMGLAQLGSGEGGPALYVSRAAVNPAGDAATVQESFRAPVDAPRPSVLRAWTLDLRRSPDGAWRLVRRTEAPLPQDDFWPH